MVIGQIYFLLFTFRNPEGKFGNLRIWKFGRLFLPTSRIAMTTVAEVASPDKSGSQ
jgi:hypothetical protein